MSQASSFLVLPKKQNQLSQARSISSLTQKSEPSWQTMSEWKQKKPVSSCLADKSLGYPCSGACFLSPVKVPGVCWLHDGSLTTIFPLPPEAVPGKVDNIYVPEGERLPLTSFICISQVFFHLYQ